MGQWVSKTDSRRARRVCLYDFLLSRHPGDVEQEGNSLRLRWNHSVSIKSGYAGFTDFSSKDTGNAVDCLTNYFDYEFPDAVAALCEFASGHEPAKMHQAEKALMNATKRPQEPHRVLIPPEPVQGPYRQLSAYLTQQRGIPPALVQILVDDGILYQEKEHNNMVFINPSRTFAELRGSNSFKPFHQVAFSDPTAFWWFKPRGLDTIPTVAYICEGAIDAISLYLVRAGTKINHAEQGLYCAIGGVANQQRIDRIKNYAADAGCQVVIAVDNDKAGEQCRQRNPDCRAWIPRLKDWNEGLLQQEKDFQKLECGFSLVDLLNDAVKRHRKRS